MELLDAYQLACRLHIGQVDKAGRPYIEHLTRVMLRVQAAGGGVTQQIASLLHNSIEDGKVTVEQLRAMGVPNDAVELVVVLSKRHDQKYEDYLATVKCNPQALLVKLADLDDNGDPARLAALPEAVAQRLSTKYQGAKRFLACK